MREYTKVEELHKNEHMEDNSLQELQTRVNSLLKDRKQFFLVGLKDIDSGQKTV